MIVEHERSGELDEHKTVETYKMLRKETTIMEVMRGIEQKLSKIEERLTVLEDAFHKKPEPPHPPELLAEVDEDIINFVKKHGKACAEDVRKAFDYRGKNAASARLNRLFTQGILEKKQAGRKVYYFIMR